MNESLPNNHERYRLGSTAVVFNNLGQVLLLKLDDGIISGWVFPSGGFEGGDSSFIITAYRELHEEAGIEPKDVELFAEDEDGLYYDFPRHQFDHWQKRGSTYVGQMKKYHLFHLINPSVEPVSSEKKIKDFKWCWREEARRLLIDPSYYDYLDQLLISNNFEDVFTNEPEDK